MLMAISRATLTRREVFGFGGLAAGTAGVAVPCTLAALEAAIADTSPTSEPEKVGSVMQTLSTYMSEASARALPDEVVEKTKRHVLDTLAAMISGSDLPPGRLALLFAREYGGKEKGTVGCLKKLCGPNRAALPKTEIAH